MYISWEKYAKAEAIDGSLHEIKIICKVRGAKTIIALIPRVEKMAEKMKAPAEKKS